MTDTLLAIKVFDEDCDICQHMERFDSAVFQGFPEVQYDKINLNRLIDSERNQIQDIVYQCLERYALNPDYTVDLPVYLFLTTTGEYKGHHVGSATLSELRDRVKTTLSVE